MSILSIFNLFGCKMPEEKTMDEEAVEYLNNKYGEEFKTVEGEWKYRGDDSLFMSSTTFNSKEAYAVNNPDRTFVVKRTQEKMKVTWTDDYQSILMEPYIKEYYEPIVKEYWPDSKFTISAFGGGTSEKLTKEEYFESMTKDKPLPPMTNIYVFVDENELNNIDKEVKKIDDFIHYIYEKNLDITLYINYTKDYRSIDLEKYLNNVNNDENDFVYTNSKSYIEYILRNEAFIETSEEIKNQLEKNMKGEN